MKLHCVRCDNEVTQEQDGSGGYELGLTKFFETLEPWAIQKLICKDCFKFLSKELKLDNRDIQVTENQKPKERCKSCDSTKHSFCTQD
jgi:hypothetical protein